MLRSNECNTVYTMEYEYFENRMDCPVCKGKSSFVIRTLVYDMPSFGKTLLISGKCESCGYRFTFSTPFEVNKGRIIEFKVEKSEDLNALVFIGENTDIEIPEFEFEFLSSDLEPGFVTTIEGLLVRVREKLVSFCSDDKCTDYIYKLNQGIEGKIPFTLKLIDRYGRSEILSEKVARKYLL